MDRDDDAARGWATVRPEPYLYRHALAHADFAGAVDLLLEDAAFLIRIDPWRGLPALRRARSRRAREHVAIFRASRLEHRGFADEMDRAGLMELDALRLQLPDARNRFAALIEAQRAERWISQWATGVGIDRSVDVLTGHHGPVSAVAYSPDARQLATASADNTVRLWDPHTGQPHGTPLTGHDGPVTAVAYSPDAKQLATASHDHTVRLWNPETGQIRAVIHTASPVFDVCFCDNTTLALVFGRDIAVYRLQTRSPAP